MVSGTGAQPGAGGLLDSSDGTDRQPLPPAHPVRGLEPGHFLAGRYRLLRPIGSGGMGDVWKVARADRTDLLALKILRESSPDGVTTQRFLREIRAISQLHHPNIVRIEDFGQTADGQPFFVMEHLRGHTLDVLLDREGPLGWRRAKALLVQVADALTHAHAHGIVHRDIKASNVFALHEAGVETCRLIDFGVAHFSGEHHGNYDTLTYTGVVHGTPAYMSPEQARGQPVDTRTDQYALGILAYQLLTGAPPFTGEGVRDIMYSQVFKHPDPLGPQVRGLPASVEAVVSRLLRKVPDLRFETMAQARAALQAMDEHAVPVQVPPEHLPQVGADGIMVEATAAPAPAPAVPRTYTGPVLAALLAGLGIGGTIAWLLVGGS